MNDYSFTLNIASERIIVYNSYCKEMIKPYGGGQTMDRHYFNPTPDTIYTNKGGGSYICLEAEGHFRAKFQRVSKYKWTFTAHGYQM